MPSFRLVPTAAKYPLPPPPKVGQFLEASYVFTLYNREKVSNLR